MTELRQRREELLREVLELGAKEEEHIERSQLMEETTVLRMKVIRLTSEV